jgi:hypothetical protein
MEGTNLVDKIADRQRRLYKAADDLKEHFVGLDAVIDRIASSIEAWYCMPELMTRPTIVNLWGLTGIGKTDLVRRLVKSLDFSDNFVEIQMTNKGSSSNTMATTLQGLLTTSNVAPEEPGVLLLDEIQRFRSIDQEGKDIHDYMFQDLWMLLSDGSFGSASDNKQQILEILLEAIYWEDYYIAQKAAKKAEDDDEEEEKEEKEVESRRKFKQTYYHARQLKRKLRLTESVEDIMKWDTTQKMKILQDKMTDKSIYKPEVYGKLLIFISGNLDEAYDMAGDTSETDVEADLFHKHSLKVNLLSVKEALQERFKPEQIARFGNTHIIYPALSRASYEEIIRRKVGEVLQNVKATSGVEIVPDNLVYDAIYRNGVFPAQGTRPVFSTISSFFEAMLPSFTLRSLRAGVTKISMTYHRKHLCAQIGAELFKMKNEGEIDRIKQEKRNDDKIRKVTVHEVGHAVAYSDQFGYMPTQVAVLVASEDKNGFIGLHSIDLTRDHLLSQIRCLLAGRIAEEIVFGKGNVNGGSVGDLQRATSLAAQLIRMYGMGTRLSRTDVQNSPLAIQSNIDIMPSNDEIEKILQEQRKEAENILRKHLNLIRDMSDHLIKFEKISNDKYLAMCKSHGVPCEVLDAKETIYPRYKDGYDAFWANKKK